MSQESTCSLDLYREIDECIESHSKHLEYSQQPTTLILPPMEQSTSIQQQHWSDSERLVLEEHLLYYNKMVLIINAAFNQGPQKLPKKPKRKLETLFKEKNGNKKIRKDVTTTHDLHKYLTENLADVNNAITRETFSENLFTPSCNSEEIIKRLEKGIRNIRRQDAQTVMIYIQFGHFLILCKSWLETERKEGRISQTWAVWLKEKTGYSDDHGRKLRALASVLYGFQQFFRVGVPLNFILSKLMLLKNMMQIPEYRDFWVLPIALPPTSQLQQSQE